MFIKHKGKKLPQWIIKGNLYINWTKTWCPWW